MRRVLLPLLLVAAPACGGDEDPTPDPEPSSHDVICGVGHEEDPIEADARWAGADGVFSLVVVSADPAPAERGTNAWTVRVEDADGNVVEDATVTADPRMPTHGHGSSPPELSGGDSPGEHVIGALALTMAGYWEVTLTVTTPDGRSDTVVVRLCIIE